MEATLVVLTLAMEDRVLVQAVAMVALAQAPTLDISLVSLE